MTTEYEIAIDASYTDKHLKKLLLQESEEVLYILYEMYAAALHGTILKLVTCTKKAEDILMHTFLNAHKQRKSVKDCPFGLFVWLMRISLQLCLKERKVNGAMIVREDILTSFFPHRWPDNKNRMQEIFN
jgi:DNA-directed RNA polymerase specialized sigma24 family protein